MAALGRARHAMISMFDVFGKNRSSRLHSVIDQRYACDEITTYMAESVLRVLTATHGHMRASLQSLHTSTQDSRHINYIELFK